MLFMTAGKVDIPNRSVAFEIREGEVYRKRCSITNLQIQFPVK